MEQSIYNDRDLIDSREVIARIAELEGAVIPEEISELEALKALLAEFNRDWYAGETFIRDSYFVTYAQELASDICGMGTAAEWPFSHIDWESAAKDLKHDYTSVKFGKVEYLIHTF